MEPQPGTKASGPPSKHAALKPSHLNLKETKDMSTLLIVLQVLLALIFLPAAVSKLVAAPAQVDHFTRFGYPQWFRIGTGMIELMGASGMVAGIWLPAAAVYAGLCLATTMVGAVYTQLFRTNHRRYHALLPVSLLLVAVAVIIGHSDLIR
jgi:putative oxidoreductase